MYTGINSLLSRTTQTLKAVSIALEDIIGAQHNGTSGMLPLKITPGTGVEKCSLPVFLMLWMITRAANYGVYYGDVYLIDKLTA